MKKYLQRLQLVAVLMLCYTTSMWAQKATIKGTVRDAQSGETIIGATLRVGPAGTVSNENGYYTLEVPSGPQILTVTYLGYKDQDFDINVADGVVEELDVDLGEAPNILNETTITSTKFSKPLGQVTVSLDIVKPELVDNSNTSSVDDVLQKVPGLSVTDGQANIRGGSGWSYGAGSRVLLLVDDMPFVQGDAGLTSWRDVPVENIDQIEVLKGAASALYGSSAMNGIINIRTAYAKSTPVTKFATYTQLTDKPRDKRNAWWGDVSPLSSGFQFAHRQKFGRLDLVMGGNGYYDNSFRQAEYSRKLRGQVNLRYRFTDEITAGINVNTNAGPSGSFFLWNNGIDVGALLGGSIINKGDTSSYSTFPGSAGTSKVFRISIDPYISIGSGNSRHKIQGRFYRSANQNSGNQSNTSNTSYAEYQYQRKFENFYNLTTVGGVVGTYTYSNSQLFGNAQYHVFNVASYIQLDAQPFDRLNVSFGARYEYNAINSPDSVTYPSGNGFERRLNPETRSREGRPVFRAGANYQVADYTYLRASWGQGYRFPTVAERYVATRIGGALNILPNPTLKSETGWSSEIGIKQGFKISNWMGFFDAAAFWTEYNNMMEFNLEGTIFSGSNFGFKSNNIGATRIRGLELSVMGSGEILGCKTNIIMGYTYIDPKYRNFERDTTSPQATPTASLSEGMRNDRLSSVNYNILKYRYKHSFKIDIETFIKRFSIGGAVIWNSRMEAIDEFFQRPGYLSGLSPEAYDWFGLDQYRNNHEKHGWIQLDLRTSYRIDDKAKVSFLVENVLNSFYTIRPALPASPRNYSIRLDYNF